MRRCRVGTGKCTHSRRCRHSCSSFHSIAHFWYASQGKCVLGHRILWLSRRSMVYLRPWPCVAAANQQQSALYSFSISSIASRHVFSGNSHPVMICIPCSCAVESRFSFSCLVCKKLTSFPREAPGLRPPTRLQPTFRKPQNSSHKNVFLQSCFSSYSNLVFLRSSSCFLNHWVCMCMRSKLLNQDTFYDFGIHYAPFTQKCL